MMVGRCFFRYPLLDEYTLPEGQCACRNSSGAGGVIKTSGFIKRMSLEDLPRDCFLHCPAGQELSENSEPIVRVRVCPPSAAWSA